MPVALGDTDLHNVLPDINFTIVRQIRYFVVENIRSARRFLKKCDRSIDIDSLTFFTLDEHTDPQDIPAMLEPAARGYDIGVISEAGCPAVADPGADLVAIAQQKNIKVMPLVGPSSILMGLMGSGFNGQSFAFHGYLPIEAKARTAAFRDMERNIRNHRQTQIFIATPYRNNRLIAEMSEKLPRDLLLCVASDISGARESIITLPVAKWRSKNYDYSKIPTIFLLFS